MEDKIKDVENEQSAENKDTRGAKAPLTKKQKYIIIASCALVAVAIVTIAVVLLLTTGHTHNPQRAVVENVVPATVQAEGSYDMVVYCSICKEELSRESEVIAKLAPAVEVNAILIGKAVVDLQVGDTYTITPSVLPKDADDKTLVWSSDNESVATVNDGVITAHAFGRAYISATAQNGIKAVCRVDVFCSPQSHVPGEPSMSNRFPASCCEYERYDIIVCCIYCYTELSEEHYVGDVYGEHGFSDGECSHCGIKESELAEQADSFLEK